MAKVSKTAHLNREGLYDMLSKKGNPRLSSLEAILEALGLKLIGSHPNARLQVEPAGSDPFHHGRVPVIEKEALSHV